jgi:uncharacterized PurR-regulated membrane protein YhhQ (DUF165 family)
MATRIIYSAAFVATIIAANAMLNRFGIVPLLGITSLMVPAGVYMAGLSFGLRDAVQEVGGRRWTVGLIVIGAGISALIDPTFAIASGCAFLLSELADLCVYSPLRERHFVWGVTASNAVGSIVDSLLFLWLAFGAVTVEGVTAMVLGKMLMTVVAVPIVWLARNRRSGCRWRRPSTSPRPRPRSSPPRHHRQHRPEEARRPRRRRPRPPLPGRLLEDRRSRRRERPMTGAVCPLCAGTGKRRIHRPGTPRRASTLIPCRCAATKGAK